ncbi:DNA cytosine methyltransferase [Streptomonospora wellingtoniae]|uniref:Cytosine-specific methyltransferase n=1 Tax=Streptomonospora wellingtoniae TaxID=3075544 RepID=A0ABU2KNF0_9ACTN|nr:DNA cytosine methyltransferase [Streptomonospora sp. DSM 45055]MDT0300718.1 DNA cytosine methyltransferase [Streptomonospora sp. DSM 45055]
MTTTLIDLFAGCGGMSAGFAEEGFHPRLAVEHNRHAASTYAANFGEDHVFNAAESGDFSGDIEALPDEAIPEVDVVIGGPPCQGFSNLGSRDVDDPRNKLWKQYIRVVRNAQPKVFVIENVDRFMRSSEFELLVSEAEGGLLKDYTLSYGLLNAADYGVAQRRPRTIVIGSRIGTVPLPKPTHSRTPQLDDQVLPWRTVRERIGELPEWPSTTLLPDTATTRFGMPIPGEFKWLDLHIGRNPTRLSLKRYDHIPPGGGRFNLPENLKPNCWRNKTTGTTDVMGRMRWDHPSLTIRTEFFKPEKGQYLHPQWESGDGHRVNRPITHLEAALLQDFPPVFVWCGTKTEVARQIGNAVPVGLAQAIARQIRQYIEG